MELSAIPPGLDMVVVFWWPDSGVVSHASRFGYWEASATPSGGRIIELTVILPSLDFGSCRPLLLVAG